MKGAKGSEPEWRNREEPESEDSNPYLYLMLGLGFIIAAVLVIITTSTAITGFPFIIAATALLGVGVSQLRGQQRAVSSPVNKEKELLSAIRDNGGSITPAEAAMQTSLTVRESDEMLSELTRGGHLQVESRDSVLYYSLPVRKERELGG